MIDFNDEVLLNKLIKLALLQKGKSYQHGEHGPNHFDCAGLIWFLHNEIYGVDIYQDGYGLSTTTKMMTSSIGSLIYDRTILNIKIGDILFFHRQSMQDNEPLPTNYYPGHCGLYLGNNNFIHASKPKGGVIISDFKKNEYWQRVLVGRKQI